MANKKRSTIVSEITKFVTIVYWGKEQLKGRVMRRFLKPVSDGSDVTFCWGRMFLSPRELRGDQKSSVADG